MGKVIGSLGIKKYHEERYPEFEEKKCREISYVLSKDYWGRGLMPEAVREVIRYLAAVKAQSQIPVMMGFGIHKASDVEPMKDVIDGAIVGSHFIQFMEKSRYAPEAAQAYCRTFKEELNASA